MGTKIIDVPGYGPTEFPDTMSDEQIVGAIKMLPTPKAEEPVSIPRIAGAGAQSTLDALATGNPVSMAFDASGYLARKAGLVSPETPYPSDAVKSFVRNAASAVPRTYDAITQGSVAPYFAPAADYETSPSNQPERIASDIGNAVGTVAGTTGIAKSAAASLKGVPQMVADAIAAKPVAQAGFMGAGNVAGSESGNPYIGMGTALALPIVAHSAQRSFSAAPAATTQEAERRALLEFGRSIDAPLTAGKIADSKKLQTVESAMNNSPLPFLGGRVGRTEMANRNAYQRAALEATGQYGETGVTPEMLDKISGRIGRVFDNLENNTTVTIDPMFGAEIANAKAGFSKQLIDQMPASIAKKLDELESAATTLGQPSVQDVTLDGATYKNIRSKLSAQLASARGIDKEPIANMIDALDGAMQRSVPSDLAADWKTARQQWRNYVALDKSVQANNAETAVGNMSTAAYGKASRNNPDIERLGQYGNAFVGDKMANTSKSASHLQAGHLLTGAGVGLYEGLQHAPTATMYAAAVASVPYAFDLMMNNPITRAALLARYRNPTQSVIDQGLVGTLAAQEAAKASR